MLENITLKKACLMELHIELFVKIDFSTGGEGSVRLNSQPFQISSYTNKSVNEMQL